MDDTTRASAADDAALAPVIPLFGARDATPVMDAAPGDADASPTAASGSSDWHATWLQEEQSPSEDEAVLAAEKQLLRKLRTRSLSVKEARAVVAEHELDAGAVEALLSRFERNGYLDDARLAEQLAFAALERKAQGRSAIAQSLVARGLPREVIDAALEALPDDEAERALEFARKKAHGMTDLDRDVALRRLTGQLARRGYGGAALSAARQALDEQARPSHGVRFR